MLKKSFRSANLYDYVHDDAIAYDYVHDDAIAHTLTGSKVQRVVDNTKLV